MTAIGAALAENGKVIVTGCMGAEPEKITAAHPKVLAVTGPQQYESVLDAVHRAAPPRARSLYRTDSAAGHQADTAALCLSQDFRGLQQSLHILHHPKIARRPGLAAGRRRAAGSRGLVEAGVKELLVISQDTSAYGVDVKYAASQWKDREVRAKFVDLARALGEFGVWVRLHYVYPYPHVDEVIGLMADGKVLPYLDMPFQHASPAVLKRMRRPAAQEETLDRIKAWRAACPSLTLRSTFIVGFPGETEEDFALLLDWLRRGRARSRRLFPLRAGLRARPQTTLPRRCPSR